MRFLNGTKTTVMFPITHYIWGLDRVLAKIDKTTNKSYYYLYNGHGDVVQIVDTSGTVKNNYDYIRTESSNADTLILKHGGFLM